MSNDLAFHTYSNLFPLITGDEFQGLLEDIDANGQCAPIVIYEGKILDGRNRYRVCKVLEIEPKLEQYVGDDALAYVLSLNLFRRQLTIGQRALIAAELSSLRGSSAFTVDLENAGEAEVEAAKLAIEEAARVLGISARSVSSACKVVRDGAPELLEAVKAGGVSISAAEQVAKLEKTNQQELCSSGAKAIRKAAKEMRQDGKPKRDEKPNSPSGRASLPPAVPHEDDEIEGTTSSHEGSDSQITAISHEDEFSYTAERRPAAQVLFEMAESGMEFGREAEGIADDIMDIVDDGLDLQFLAFVVDVAKRLEGRVRAKMVARYAE